jgi:hypothetical protein
MNWSRVTFTHICEWKRHSHYSGFSGSSCWNFVVVMVTLGSTSMIVFPFSSSESNSDSTFDPEAFVSTNHHCLECHSSIVFQGILWNLHHFLVSFFNFPLPLFIDGLDWFSWDRPSLLYHFPWDLGTPLPYFKCCGFADPNSHLFFC